MDNEGYITEDELKLIREWPHSDFVGLVEFIIYNWWCRYGVRWTKQKVKAKYGNSYYKFNLSTGGWSGNEETICAMQDNRLFWGMCFYSHFRGGHYEFHIPIIKTEKP